MRKVKQAQRQLEVSRNNACDFGWRAFLKKKLPHRLSFQAGVDYYGRIGVDMENETWRQGVLSDSSVPLADGRRSDVGVYSTLAWTAPAGFELLAGGRLGAFSRSAVSAGVLQKKQFTGAGVLPGRHAQDRENPDPVRQCRHRLSPAVAE